jgi:hypothetical protein
MKRLALDPQRRLARAEAGLLTRELHAATRPLGLAAVLGDGLDVGISGLTLGGGLGWLAGMYGAASDNLHPSMRLYSYAQLHCAINFCTAPSTTVPVKKSGFIAVHSVTGLVNTKSRKSSALSTPLFTSSCASATTSVISGTSQ